MDVEPLEFVVETFPTRGQLYLTWEEKDGKPVKGIEPLTDQVRI